MSEESLKAVIDELHEERKKLESENRRLIGESEGYRLNRNELEKENHRLREALQVYASCSDGCTCGDGWNHDTAKQALENGSPTGDTVDAVRPDREAR